MRARQFILRKMKWGNGICQGLWLCQRKWGPWLSRQVTPNGPCRRCRALVIVFVIVIVIAIGCSLESISEPTLCAQT
jgi:hypothetical protein